MKRAQLRVHFVYLLFNARGEPHYVGMSRWQYRISTHEKRQAGGGVRVASNLTKTCAKVLEALLIGFYKEAYPHTLINQATHSNKGWRHSAHQRAVVGAMRRGVPKSEATKAKLRQAMLGRTISAEHKKAISLAHARRKAAKDV